MSSPPEGKLDPPRKSRIHLDASECSKLANSPEGRIPLISPNQGTTSSEGSNKVFCGQRILKPDSSTAENKRNSASGMLGKRNHSHMEKGQESVHAYSSQKISGTGQQTASNTKMKKTKKFSNLGFKKLQIEAHYEKNKIKKYFGTKISTNPLTQKLMLESVKFTPMTKNEAGSPQARCNIFGKQSNSSLLSDFELNPGASSVPFITPATISNVDIKDDHFGLFGASGNYEGVLDNPNHLECLPIEVLENILCQLPLLDLLNCKRVCQLWNTVISSAKFIHWKLTYFKLKYGCVKTKIEVTAMLTSAGGTCVLTCFKGLIRFMHDNFSCKPAHDIFYHLKKHKKYITAETVMRERMPELLSEELNPWCIVVIIIFLCGELPDVEDVFYRLLHSQTAPEALDVMYCIATFLLFCKNEFTTNPGYHYRVYAALHTFENEVSLKHIVPLNPARLTSAPKNIYEDCSPAVRKLTVQQLQIINHKFQPGDVIRITAFAGSGKTSTLIELAKRYPHVKFLNIMFNKSVVEHAKKVFPPNVDCRNSHSWAFASFGKLYSSNISERLNIKSVKEWMNEKQPLVDPCHYKYVYHTILAFVASDDKSIELKHVPWEKTLLYNTRTTICDYVRHATLSAAQLLWNCLIEKKANIKIWHDFYLKLFQLSKPKLGNYECIMVDDAQDCNAALLDIILSQNVPVILVGDHHQQVYPFLGSKNALDSVRCNHIYHLSKSFRFGPKIAYVASCCVEVLKNNKRNTLVGCEKESSISGELHGQYAIIARSNSGLFKQVVRLCCDRDDKTMYEPNEIKGAFAGGISGYGLDKIMDIYYLKKKSLFQSGLSHSNGILEPKCSFIGSFQSYSSLREYAQEKDDEDLLGKIHIVERYDSLIPHYIEIIKRRCNATMESATVIFATAHEARGLEFDTVCLANDFGVGRFPMEDVSLDMCEEYNILYLAITRAKKSLVMSEDLVNILLKAQEKFEYPVWSSDVLKKDTSTFGCVLCGCVYYPDNELVLFRQGVCTSHGKEIAEGPLCAHCSQKRYYRPRISRDPVVMLLDPLEDYAHSSIEFMFAPLNTQPSEFDLQDIQPGLHVLNEVMFIINMF